MIRLVTGPLGTGKSYYMVKTGVEALESGKMLVTNFDLEPDWARRVSRRRRLFPNGKRARAYEQSLKQRYRRVDSLQELMQLRIQRQKPWVKEDRQGNPVCGPNGLPILKEGQCVVLLDEAHRWMNARNWSKEGREEILEFFALARKYGFVVLLGSQRAENLDVQVRELFEDHIQLENLKYSARLLGIRVIPFNLFLAAWSNHGWPGRFVKEERYLLKWYRHLYDTMDTGSFSEVGEDLNAAAIYMPHEDLEPAGLATMIPGQDELPAAADQDRAGAAGAGADLPPATDSSPDRVPSSPPQDPSLPA